MPLFLYFQDFLPFRGGFSCHCDIHIYAFLCQISISEGYVSNCTGKTETIVEARAQKPLLLSLCQLLYLCVYSCFIYRYISIAICLFHLQEHQPYLNQIIWYKEFLTLLVTIHVHLLWTSECVLVVDVVYALEADDIHSSSDEAVCVECGNMCSFSSLMF